jgi:outer membrane protein assembly factor BamB
MSVRIAVLSLAALLLAACSGKENVREPAELQDIASPEVQPKRAWSRGVGHGDHFSRLAVAVADDALFVVNQAGRVRALNPENGRPVWERRTKTRAIAGPAVAADLVLFGTLDAEVIALSRADGSERWRAKVSSEVLAAPVASRELVIVRTVDGRLHGLALESGERRWTFDRGVPSLTLRGLSAPLLHGGRLFVGMDNGRVAAIDPRSGQLLWEQVIAAPTGRSELERLADIDADIVAEGAELYVASVGGELACVDGETGQVLWRRSISSYSGMVLVDDKLVVSDTDGRVWALDARTGAAAWKQEDLLYRRLSAPALKDGLLVVGDFEGYLHWLSPRDGRLVGRVRAGDAPLQARPMPVAERLVVYSREGRLFAVGTRSE